MLLLNNKGLPITDSLTNTKDILVEINKFHKYKEYEPVKI